MFIMPVSLTALKVLPLWGSPRLSTPASPGHSDASYWASQVAAVALRRDVECFMRIYDFYAPRLQRYLQGRGLPPAQAEELVQESMLRLWRRAALFDPARASLATWLFRVARNLHLDSLRGEPKWLPIEDGLAWLDEQAMRDPVAGTDRNADYAGLKQAIDQLPALEARLVRMSYFEAWSHSEIAAELSMPLGSVKTALRRAFAKLQAGLGERS